MECVYKSTFSLSLVGRFVLFWSVLYQRLHCTVYCVSTLISIPIPHPGLVPEQTCPLPQAGAHWKRQPAQQVPPETPAETTTESGRSSHSGHVQLLPILRYHQPRPGHAHVPAASVSVRTRVRLPSELYPEQQRRHDSWRRHFRRAYDYPKRSDLAGVSAHQGVHPSAG